MMRLLILCFISSCFTFSLSGQADSLLVTKNFLFQDGVYSSFAAFQRNQPDYSWEELRSNVISNPQTYIAKVEFIKHRETGRAVPLDSIWGICLAGLPYVRIAPNVDDAELTKFAALRVRGKICYYEYPGYEEVTVPIKAYNPYTGKPYLESSIKRMKPVMEEWIMDFDSGEVLRLNPQNLLSWVQNDYQLVEAIESLGEEAWDWDKLFKCILIYDDRHPTYIKR